MIYLVTYDIEADRLRSKVADKLLDYGLERVQYSVFMGPLKKSSLSDLRAQLSVLFEKANPEKDQILIMPLTPLNVERHETLGRDLSGWEYWINREGVLFL